MARKDMTQGLIEMGFYVYRETPHTSSMRRDVTDSGAYVLVTSEDGASHDLTDDEDYYLVGVYADEEHMIDVNGNDVELDRVHRDVIVEFLRGMGV